ncbi:transposable element Tcb2 transposase [Trichonephila clavipes]|nr:transposable element Tcb2 transposase [Trichonephila clavipes]
MFSDESRFSLQSYSRRTLIWRAPGTRYHQENTIERHRYGCAGWLVWGGIILGSRTDLHIQSVTTTGRIYRDVILEQHVRLFRGAMSAEFLFMDDNARPPRANIVDECLQSEDISRMDWPAYSPGLNPIEHVWDMLGRRIAARQTPPTCLPELRRALLDEWCNIPQDQIDNLILSMPRRCKARPRAVLLTRWIVRSVPLEIVGSSEHEKVPTREKRGLEQPGKPRGEDRRIVRQALVDPTVTRSTIREDVGVAIIPQTISRHLAEANRKSQRTFRALPLKPEYRQLRLQWCQARSMWNVTYWQKVVFREESRFVFGTDDIRVRVWRRPCERYNSPLTVLRHTACTADVIVWGAIAYDSRSTLIVMRGALTVQRYVDDILRPHVGPFLNGLPGAIFQQDNARPHTARVVQNFLRHFQGLPWPARSPDLPPVEHVWDQLKRQMPSCHSVHDLELAVQDLWAHLPQDNIRCLINSMPDRVAACIVAGGGPTRY